MANFAIFTYQFQRVIKGAELALEYGEEFESPITTDADWDARQQCFGKLFQLRKPVVVKAGEVDYLNEVIYISDNIIILRIANNKKVKIVGKDFKDSEVDSYPHCLVIFDNRDGIQRMMVQNKKSAWNSPKSTANVIYEAFDGLMMEAFAMHFKPGDVPTYPQHTFWEAVRANPVGFSKVRFSFPPLNLARLVSLADNVDMIRDETGGGIDIELKAPDQGVLRLEEHESVQTNALVALSSAGGYIVKAWRKGSNVCYKIGASEQDAITMQLPDSLLETLPIPQLFGKDLQDLLISALNDLKNVYD